MSRFDLDDLCRKLLQIDVRVIFVEGVRCSGKTVLSKILLDTLNRLRGEQPVWSLYTTFQSRKIKTSFRDADMDVGQATLFIMDLLQQCPDLRLVCDRSTISTVVFNELKKIYSDQPWILDTDSDKVARRYQLFVELLPIVRGVVFYHEVSNKILNERIEVAGRAHETFSIMREIDIYEEVLKAVPKPAIIRSLQSGLLLERN